MVGIIDAKLIAISMMTLNSFKFNEIRILEFLLKYYCNEEKQPFGKMSMEINSKK